MTSSVYAPVSTKFKIGQRIRLKTDGSIGVVYLAPFRIRAVGEPIVWAMYGGVGLWCTESACTLVESEKPALDLSKPVQTRGAEDYPSEHVRILCTDASSHWPVVGLLGGSHPVQWSRDGKRQGYSASGAYDLVNVPPPKAEATRVVRLHQKGGITIVREQSTTIEAAKADDIKRGLKLFKDQGPVVGYAVVTIKEGDGL